MKLGTINRLLRVFGLVLVVESPGKPVESTRLWIETVASFERRAKAFVGWVKR